MRFDEMKRHYPFIYQFFEQVAGQVHAGATPEMSMGSLRREIDSKIRPEHREAVTGKLTRWAQLVEENNRRGPPEGTVYYPGIKTIAEQLKAKGLCICDFCEEYYCRLCGLKQYSQED